jgi:hypothetical protein
MKNTDKKIQSEWSIFCDLYNEQLKNENDVFEIANELLYLSKISIIPDTTYGCLISEIMNVIADFSDDNFVTNISFNPLEKPDDFLSIFDFIKKDNQIFIYQPNYFSTKFADMLGKAFKTMLYKLLLEKNKYFKLVEKPIFYICDEFQRFITGDDKSGEQSFLDRCRAYRVTCILATQSLASLKHALLKYNDTNTADASLGIILNNTGNKLFFRNTDVETSNSLSMMIPTASKYDKSHIIQTRPISTLSPGECYYLLSNGVWGRAQVNITEEMLNSVSLENGYYKLFEA